MIEVYPNLFVGGDRDYHRIRREPGWFIIQAARDPWHRQALGYTGRGAPKDHREYLFARRDNRLILNLLDAHDIRYISAEVIDAAIEAIRENIAGTRVLLHCNRGRSRSASIAFLFLLKHTDTFAGLDRMDAIREFKKLYPDFAPAPGLAAFIRLHFREYAESALALA